MGTGAIGPTILAGSSEGGISTEAIRNELKMLENKDEELDHFNQVQFGGEFAEIGKLARNIDDVSIDSARVDLKERGGDDLEGRLNIHSILKDEEDELKQQMSETPEQRRASAMRRAAGTGAGYVDNNPRGKGKYHRGDSGDADQKH